MFVNAKDTRVEDLGGGVKRKVLAHDGGLMQVEVAFDAGWIDAEAVLRRADLLGKTDYAKYLRRRVGSDW